MGKKTPQSGMMELYPYPLEGTVKVSNRCKLGDRRYGDGDWKFKDADWVAERVQHMETHLEYFRLFGNRIDDNVGAIIWGGYMLAWYETNRPEIFKKALKLLPRKEAKNEQQSKRTKSEPAGAGRGTKASKVIPVNIQPSPGLLAPRRPGRGRSGADSRKRGGRGR